MIKEEVDYKKLLNKFLRKFKTINGFRVLEKVNKYEVQLVNVNTHCLNSTSLLHANKKTFQNYGTSKFKRKTRWGLRLAFAAADRRADATPRPPVS